MTLFTSRQNTEIFKEYFFNNSWSEAEQRVNITIDFSEKTFVAKKIFSGFPADIADWVATDYFPYASAILSEFFKSFQIPGAVLLYRHRTNNETTKKVALHSDNSSWLEVTINLDEEIFVMKYHIGKFETDDWQLHNDSISPSNLFNRYLMGKQVRTTLHLTDLSQL